VYSVDIKPRSSTAAKLHAKVELAMQCCARTPARQCPKLVIDLVLQLLDVIVRFRFTLDKDHSRYTVQCGLVHDWQDKKDMAKGQINLRLQINVILVKI